MSQNGQQIFHFLKVKKKYIIKKISNTKISETQVKKAKHCEW